MHSTEHLVHYLHQTSLTIWESKRFRFTSKSRERPTLSSLLLKDMFQVVDGIPIPILMCSSGISAKLRLLGLLHLSLFTVLFLNLYVVASQGNLPHIAIGCWPLAPPVLKGAGWGFHPKWGLVTLPRFPLPCYPQLGPADQAVRGGGAPTDLLCVPSCSGAPATISFTQQMTGGVFRGSYGYYCWSPKGGQAGKVVKSVNLGLTSWCVAVCPEWSGHGAGGQWGASACRSDSPGYAAFFVPKLDNKKFKQTRCCSVGGHEYSIECSHMHVFDLQITLYSYSFSSSVSHCTIY